MRKYKKTKQASEVLQLMDEDFTYPEALRKVLKKNKKLTRTKLEKDLNPFI